MTKAIQLVLTATVVTLGACGGSGTVTIESRLRPAGRRDLQDRQRAARHDHQPRRQPSDALARSGAIYTSTVIPLFRKELGSLQALQPPAADRATVKKMLDDLSSGVDQLEAGVREREDLGRARARSRRRT